jgi:hypothetical protein
MTEGLSIHVHDFLQEVNSYSANEELHWSCKLWMKMALICIMMYYGEGIA